MLNKFIPFLLLPILTHYISPEGYGIISIIQIIISFFTVIISLNFNGAYLRYYYKLIKKEQNKLLFNIIIFTVINFISITVISFLILLFGHLSFIDIFDIDNMWLYIALVISFSNSIMAMILINFQIDNNPIKYSLITISYSIVNICFSLLLIVYFNYGWEGRILGILISSILLLIITFIGYKKENSLNLDNYNKDYKNKIYKFGLPLLPHALSGLILVSVDKLFLNNMIGLSSVGIYAVAYQFAMIISIVASSINNAWSPYFFKNMENRNISISLLIRKMIYIAIILFIIVLLLILASKWLILNFFNVKYHEAIQYIAIIAWGHFFEGLYVILSNFILFYHKNIYLSYLTIFAVFINIILNIVFINSMGIYGAALATLISYFIYFVIVILYTAYLIKKEKRENKI
jgi:O-antigen/teichoic acid export membrane protein